MTKNRNPDRHFGPVLVGMRGTGKSSVAPLVAVHLGMNAVDADAELERRAGKTISTIFAEEGEGGFRARERELLLDFALPQENAVVATGGGAVLHPEVRQALGARFTVWLHAPISLLATRIAESSRPSLTGRPIAEELEQIFQQREAFYREVSSLELDSSRSSIAALAHEIAAAWRSCCGK